MFTLEVSVRLHDTDSAGLLFFGHQFKIAHDAYESMMEEIGFSFASILSESDYLLPIVHAEADYKSELKSGDRLRVNLRVENIGDSSFTLSYDLVDINDESAGTVRTVHVCMSRSSRRKKSLPEDLRQALTIHS